MTRPPFSRDARSGSLNASRGRRRRAGRDEPPAALVQFLVKAEQRALPVIASGAASASSTHTSANSP